MGVERRAYQHEHDCDCETRGFGTEYGAMGGARGGVEGEKIWKGRGARIADVLTPK